jgi:hypothetical protein
LGFTPDLPSFPAYSGRCVGSRRHSRKLTEDKATELICIADDFCKFFDAMMEKDSSALADNFEGMVFQGHQDGSSINSDEEYLL